MLVAVYWKVSLTAGAPVSDHRVRHPPATCSVTGAPGTTTGLKPETCQVLPTCHTILATRACLRAERCWLLHALLLTSS